MGFDLIDVTAKRAALTPDRIAFEDVLSGRTLSYAQLEDRVAHCADVLAGLGVGREDRVAILCRNRIEFFEILFACAKLGAILVPLNWRAPTAELAPLLDDCTPKVLLFGCEDAETALASRRQHLTLVALDPLGPPAPSPAGATAAGEGGPYGYESLLACASPLRTDARWPGEAIWSLLYTSGTTGQPKAVIQTFQMAAVNAFHVAQAFGVRGGDRTLNFLPLFHSAGIQLVTLPTLIAGGTVSVLAGFDVERALALMARLDVVFAVPAIYQQLALHPHFEETDLSRVRAWGCGGSPLPDALVKRYAAKGVRVCNGYGMTETGPTAFVAAPEDALAHIGSVGKPQMLLEARIIDLQGREVGAGEIGEIWMRGPGLTPGYWNRPEETTSAFTADGWLKSGDLGSADDSGRYYVAGRIKEMYISGGENVYPAEVENVLARHPGVLEAAIIAIADLKWGEVGCAFVLARPEAPLPDSAELEQHCRAHLAAYKVPKTFVLVDDLPRTAVGKVRKHLLHQQAPRHE
jgi:fatty-acyl-CoA synthase